jgi:hypothetical protein
LVNHQEPLVYNAETGNWQNPSAYPGPGGEPVGVAITAPDGSVVTLDCSQGTAQLTVTDPDGNTRITSGQQGDGTYTTVDADGVAPKPPSTPTVVGAINGVFVVWNGLMDDSSAPLSDFKWVEVHVSPTSGFTPSSATLQGHLNLNGGAYAVGNLTPGTTYYAALVADNTSGVSSTPSTEASAVAQSVPSNIPDGTITAAQVDFTARQIGGVTTTISATEPSSPNAGDLWINTSNGNQLEQYNGTSWTAVSWTASSVLTAGSVTAALLSGSVTARALGGITTTIASSAPASPNAGDIWLNSSNGYQINQYSGTAWVAVSFNATDVISAGTIQGSLIEAATITGSLIAAGTITAANIAANTITASQIASGTITATQIAAGTITSSQIAAGTIQASNIAAGVITGSLIAAGTITAANIDSGTITATQIASGTITASLLAAGIVVAGIVNGTTITGASIVADGTAGEVLVYSGSPAAGNLIGSWSGTAGVDSEGNAYPQGLWVNVGQILASSVETDTLTANPGPILLYGNPSTVVVNLTGSGNWSVPAGLSVAKVECWGASGGTAGAGSTSGAGGAGAGAYSCEPELAVTGGGTCAYACGAAGSNSGTDGGTTTFAGTSVTVTASGGDGVTSGTPAGGDGGPASSNTVSFPGGDGGDGEGTAGAGGGSSAGPLSAGNAGSPSNGTVGGAGGGAPSGGGAGGAGGGVGAVGHAGMSPGGAPGGAGKGESTGTAGTAGAIRVTYTPSGSTELVASLAATAGTDPNTGDSYPGPGLGLAAVGTPAALSGWAAAYATSLDNLAFVSGSDGNSYGTGTMRLQISGTQTISSTTAEVIAGSVSGTLEAAVTEGTYRIRAQVGVKDSTAVAPTIAFHGPAVNANLCGSFLKWYSVSGDSVSPQGFNNSSLPSLTGPSMVANDFYVFEADLTVEFTADGTLSLQASTGTSGDDYVISYGFMDISPCG